MAVKDVNILNIDSKRLLNDEQYYKYIFKKTEKISCTVLYLLSTVKENKRQEGLVSDVESAARDTHTHIVRSLEVMVFDCGDCMRVNAHQLITLESKLRLLQSVGVIPADFLHVISAEIEGVLRSMSKYTATNKQSFITGTDQIPASAAPKKATQPARQMIPSFANVPVPTGASTAEKKSNRRDRILEVLRDKGQASIKDISDIIVNCSEKTVQRELNSMIEDNIVYRTGERRWSKYSIK